MPSSLKWKRILLKIGGEALAGKEGSGIFFPRLSWISEEIRKVKEMGVSIGIMVGGGNIWRGEKAAQEGIDRATGDYMGMLATIINGLALQSALENRGIQTRLMTAIRMEEVAEPYIRRRAIRHLEKGRIVIFAGGTGNPYFTTDTAAALRAVEIKAEIMLKASLVDGVYDKDPKKYEDAKKYEKTNYNEVLSLNLGIIDATAVALLRENKIPLIVFNIFEKDTITKAIKGDKCGTLVVP